MEELAKAIQKKYVEDISSKYPLYRFVCLLIFLIASHSYENNSGQGLLSYIGVIKIGFVFDFKSGLVSMVTIENFAICLMLVFATQVIYSSFKDKAFKILSKTSNYKKYIKEITESIDCEKSSDETLNYFLSKDISKQLDESRSVIRSLHSSSEIFLSVFVAFLWGIEFWNIGEVFVAISCLVIVGWNQWRSFKYYISTFLPYYITEKVLLGGKVNFGEQ